MRTGSSRKNKSKKHSRRHHHLDELSSPTSPHKSKKRSRSNRRQTSEESPPRQASDSASPPREASRRSPRKHKILEQIQNPELDLKQKIKKSKRKSDRRPPEPDEEEQDLRINRKRSKLIIIRDDLTSDDSSSPWKMKETVASQHGLKPSSEWQLAELHSPPSGSSKRDQIPQRRDVPPKEQSDSDMQVVQEEPDEAMDSSQEAKSALDFEEPGEVPQAKQADEARENLPSQEAEDPPPKEKILAHAPLPNPYSQDNFGPGFSISFSSQKLPSRKQSRQSSFIEQTKGMGCGGDRKQQGFFPRIPHSAYEGQAPFQQAEARSCSEVYTTIEEKLAQEFGQAPTFPSNTPTPEHAPNDLAEPKIQSSRDCSNLSLPHERDLEEKDEFEEECKRLEQQQLLKDNSAAAEKIQKEEEPDQIGKEQESICQTLAEMGMKKKLIVEAGPTLNEADLEMKDEQDALRDGVDEQALAVQCREEKPGDPVLPSDKSLLKEPSRTSDSQGPLRDEDQEQLEDLRIQVKESKPSQSNAEKAVREAQVGSNEEQHIEEAISLEREEQEGAPTAGEPQGPPPISSEFLQELGSEPQPDQAQVELPTKLDASSFPIVPMEKMDFANSGGAEGAIPNLDSVQNPAAGFQSSGPGAAEGASSRDPEAPSTLQSPANPLLDYNIPVPLANLSKPNKSLATPAGRSPFEKPSPSSLPIRPIPHQSPLRPTNTPSKQSAQTEIPDHVRKFFNQKYKQWAQSSEEARQIIAATKPKVAASISPGIDPKPANSPPAAEENATVGSGETQPAKLPYYVNPTNEESIANMPNPFLSEIKVQVENSSQRSNEQPGQPPQKKRKDSDEEYFPEISSKEQQPLEISERSTRRRPSPGLRSERHSAPCNPSPTRSLDHKTEDEVSIRNNLTEDEEDSFADLPLQSQFDQSGSEGEGNRCRDSARSGRDAGRSDSDDGILEPEKLYQSSPKKRGREEEESDEDQEREDQGMTCQPAPGQWPPQQQYLPCQLPYQPSPFQYHPQFHPSYPPQYYGGSIGYPPVQYALPPQGPVAYPYQAVPGFSPPTPPLSQPQAPQAHDDGDSEPEEPPQRPEEETREQKSAIEIKSLRSQLAEERAIRRKREQEIAWLVFKQEVKDAEALAIEEDLRTTTDNLADEEEEDDLDDELINSGCNELPPSLPKSGLPKYNYTGFKQFQNSEQASILRSQVPRSEKSKFIRQKWKELSPAERSHYRKVGNEQKRIDEEAGLPKRPPTAVGLFMQKMCLEEPEFKKMPGEKRLTVLSDMWKSMTAEQKDPFILKSKQLREDYKDKLDQFKLNRAADPAGKNSLVAPMNLPPQLGQQNPFEQGGLFGQLDLTTQASLLQAHGQNPTALRGQFPSQLPLMSPNLDQLQQNQFGSLASAGALAPPAAPFGQLPPLGSLMAAPSEQNSESLNAQVLQIENNLKQRRLQGKASTTPPASGYSDRTGWKKSKKGAKNRMMMGTKPKRPLSAYFYFVRHFYATRKGMLVGLDTQMRSKILSELWKQLPEESKKLFVDTAAVDQHRYHVQFESYKATNSFQIIEVPEQQYGNVPTDIEIKNTIYQLTSSSSKAKRTPDQRSATSRKALKAQTQFGEIQAPKIDRKWGYNESEEQIDVADQFNQNQAGQANGKEAEQNPNAFIFPPNQLDLSPTALFPSGGLS